MLFWTICLFAAWFLLAFNYLGYAIIALIINKIYPLRESGASLPDAPLPHLTFIVAAYNEVECIRAKIENCLAQDYPPELVEWLFVTDGSTDSTPYVIREYPSVRLLHRPVRAGKSAALNRAVAEASHDIIIASDANTLLNKDAIRQIAAHYASPTTGGVAGEKRVLGSQEGIYWKYESRLKSIDSSFYSVVGAAGELFSFRRSLYEPVGDEIVLDDFVISMRIAAKGYRIIYEPGACAEEKPSASLEDERKRKIRIAAGGFQAVSLIGLTPGNARLNYLYISHRVFRWWVSPFCLPLSAVAGTILALRAPSQIYLWLWWCQVAFYVLGLVPGKLGKVLHYFIFMNLSVLQGFVRWLRGRQPAAWEKARRS